MNVFMNDIKLKTLSAMACAVILACSTTTVLAQSAPDAPAAAPAKPLNLDARQIAKELVKEDPQPAPAPAPEKLSAAQTKMDDTFTKAEKPGLIPKVTEIAVPGAPQRVTKVTSAAGTYCVYSPTTARTDGIDQIQNDMQNQVRTCPSE